MSANPTSNAKSLRHCFALSRFHWKFSLLENFYEKLLGAIGIMNYPLAIRVSLRIAKTHRNELEFVFAFRDEQFEAI